MIPPPDFMNPGIPEIFKNTVSNKSQAEQNPENRKNQDLVIGMKLIRVERLQNNDYKRQKNAQDQAHQYFSLDGGCEMDLFLEECHFAITYRLYHIYLSVPKQIGCNDPAWAIQNPQTILVGLRILFPGFSD